MDRKDFYLLIDDICDQDPGQIKGGESLSDTTIVDSLTMLGLIAMLDSNFKIQLKPDQIQAIGTVDDLFDKINERTSCKC